MVPLNLHSGHHFVVFVLAVSCVALTGCSKQGDTENTVEDNACTDIVQDAEYAYYNTTTNSNGKEKPDTTSGLTCTTCVTQAYGTESGDSTYSARAVVQLAAWAGGIDQDKNYDDLVRAGGMACCLEMVAQNIQTKTKFDMILLQYYLLWISQKLRIGFRNQNLVFSFYSWK